MNDEIGLGLSGLGGLAGLGGLGDFTSENQYRVHNNNNNQDQLQFDAQKQEYERKRNVEESGRNFAWNEDEKGSKK